ncbi:bromodomain-containing protein 4-like protein isoform X3 [Cinnamomum micranthum f. kanehirae]|uniref:Bromodomain-containing protein 4-like protein isoform X3 n=1 Tax=Cinnamomum micranthum f. kanehirae TaxID=337451 RepID=A0A3S3NCY4_9MAGN|nr:bromodomain-containing protein 4-like protein isoform X3 [Cinnamomum micranthum f. kanehirae]
MRRRTRSRSSQSSSVQPLEETSETQSQPTPTEVGGIDSSSSSNIGKKRTRGSTRGIKLFNRRPGDKLIVQFNTEGQPIGENARSFSTLCGIVVRAPGNAPLQVTKWADVSEQAKEKMWRHIQETAVVDEERKKWVLQSLGKKYRDYRKDMKDKYYSSWNTDEERLQHRPPDVSSEDWAWLVRYWGNPEVQAVAAKNKANRSRQTVKHTGGTKSFARYRDEEARNRADGSIPSRVDLFIRTHTRKDGTPVDEKSAEIISKFRELNATQGGSSSSIGDDIYTQVMGVERHGRQLEEWKKNQEEEKRAYLEEMQLMRATVAEMRRQICGQQPNPSERVEDPLSLPWRRRRSLRRNPRA